MAQSKEMVGDKRHFYNHTYAHTLTHTHRKKILLWTQCCELGLRECDIIGAYPASDEAQAIHIFGFGVQQMCELLGNDVNENGYRDKS